MASPETFILVLNVSVILVAFGFVYPKFGGSDGYRIAKYDIAVTAIPLLVAGLTFWGRGEPFNALVAELNWFWFTLITYWLLEIPAILWYFNKHNVWASLRNPERD